MEDPVAAQPPPFRYEWPPFPEPPPGVTIIPFVDFQPLGIPVVVGDDVQERDSYGVPTVHLSKDNGKPKKRYVDGKRLIWHEEWEIDEKQRKSNIDPAINRIDRLHQVANEFKSSRLWPPPAPTSEGNVSLLWDYWRLYLGLISVIQSEPKKDKNQQYDVNQDLGSDDEVQDESKQGEKKHTVAMVDNPEKRKEVEEKRRTQEVRQELDEQALERIQRARDRRDGRKDFFLNDPELSVKIFLSSHFRDKGYIYSNKYCFEAPKLLKFFLNYVLRSNVFPEETAGLQRAVKLCERAERELPGAGRLGQILPDSFNQGMQDLNGMMTSGMFGVGLVFGDDGDSDDSSSEEESDDEEPAAKKQRTDEALQELVKDQPGLQIIDPDSMDLDSAEVQDAVADNVDQNGAEVQAESGWGTINDSSWGDALNSWTEKMQVDDWLDVKLKNDVFPILGPTALPFTHTTGIVERSTRRIESVVRPRSDDPAKSAFESQAEAIEDELETKLAYMVLTPWVKVGNHVASDIVKPQILPDSRGPVIVPKLTSSEARNHGLTEEARNPQALPDQYPNAGPPFDPTTDKIRVLLDPEAAEMLEEYVGMGVNATWVQVARKEQPGDDVNETSSKAWKRKGKRRGAPGKYGQPIQWWYMEQLGFTLTSFHTDMYYADQDEEANN